MPASDAELILAARTDPVAVGTLYRRRAEAVHGFLAARSPGPVAGELTAETFAQAALSLGRFRDEAEGSALPWLYGIARNLLHGYYARERRRRPLAVRRLPPPPEDDRRRTGRVAERIEGEAGPLCSAAELVRTETIALAVLRSTFAPRTDADATKAAVDQAIGEKLAPCEGRQWAARRSVGQCRAPAEVEADARRRVKRLRAYAILSSR